MRSRGREYLAYVTDLLKKRICETDEKIETVRRDIEGMHDYYWENYTEMDEYGYEVYDNQQALLTQMNAKTQTEKMRRRLHRLLDAPFFGSVDFAYEGDDEEAERFYIGPANFSERTGQVPLIYDWRAPVSGLFYDYDRGAAAYDSPGGRMEGEILSKWQYKIRGGKLIYEFESDTKIDDEILMQELGATSDVQMRTIVRTIQKEQNAIIRNTQDRILVIQGAAGSGKTSIALHRIAYLLYHDRDRLKSSNVLILSPNSVFSDYISHVLPELGEENILEMSFDLFAYRELKQVAADCEDRYHCIEHRMRGAGAASGAWKQSEAFVQAAEGFLIGLEDRLIEFRDVEYRGYVMRAEEIMKLFYGSFMETPLLARLQLVMDAFVDGYETLRGKALKTEELDFLRSRFQRMYVTTDVYEIYNWMLEEQGIRTLERVPVEQRMLEYEDVYPLLYLKQRLLGSDRRRSIRHLVIDEMQDYTYLQYVILECMFACRMTILGDRAQTVDGSGQDVQTFLPRIFGRGIRRIEMKKSYRNTAEIAAFAARVSGITDIEYLQRHGKPVEERQFPARTDALAEVLRCVRLGEDGYETAAVLTRTEAEAKTCFQYLQQHAQEGCPVSYIDRDSTAFRRGLTVTTFYQAKGLEFDQVFLVKGGCKNPFDAPFLYIGATRALHELYVYGF